MDQKPEEMEENIKINTILLLPHMISFCVLVYLTWKYSNIHKININNILNTPNDA